MKKLFFVMSIILLWSIPTTIKAQDVNSMENLKNVLLVKLDSATTAEASLHPKQCKSIKKTIATSLKYTDLSISCYEKGDNEKHIKYAQKAFNYYRKAKEKYKDILYEAKFVETQNLK